MIPNRAKRLICSHTCINLLHKMLSLLGMSEATLLAKYVCTTQVVILDTCVIACLAVHPLSKILCGVNGFQGHYSVLRSYIIYI